MTIWEFVAAMDGWRKAHEPEGRPPEMDDQSLSELGIEGF